MITVPTSPFAYSYYTPSPQSYTSLPYPDQFSPIQQDFSMAHHDQSMSHSMHPPSSPPIPIDPALALYPPYYPNYQQTPHHLPQHLSLPPSYSSPSSQGSDTLGTPPIEHMYPSSSHAKRPASSISNGPVNESRKKARKEEDSDERSPTAEKDEPKAKPTRGSRACTVCRRLKMKCVGAEQGPPCKRCQAGNHECIFEESNRGKRSSKKHELLTRSLRKMERTLDSVLRSIGNPSIASGMVSRSPSPSIQNTSTQALLAESPTPPPNTSYQEAPQGSPKLHSLPDNSLNPLGLLAEASLANRRAHASNSGSLTARNESNGPPKLGVASDNYFKPGPMTILPLRRLYIERQVQPEMLSFVATEDVVALFKIFFDHLNMHCNLFDPEFHTPSLVCSRSPFLLTTICAISSKFYDAKPDLHLRLTELAKKLAFSVPAKGYKSVEIVQAYLLLTMWGCGAVERYEQDKTWLLLGMAIRMATDLNLHRKTAVASDGTEEGRSRDREVHNRERTWILCFVLDRSLSAQMGKPHSTKEDFIIRNAYQWQRSHVAIPSDTSLSSYLGFIRVISRHLDVLYSSSDSPSGLQTTFDYNLIIKTFEAELIEWQQVWLGTRPWEKEALPSGDFKKHIAVFFYNYALLVLHSFGLQNALERSPIDIGYFFARCHTAAVTCATIVRDYLGPSGFLKYSPDSYFVQTSYAVLSLLKFLRPEFQPFLDNEQDTLNLVNDIADVLEKASVNSTHTPALYSRFLRALVSAKLHPPTSGTGGDNKPQSDRGDQNDNTQNESGNIDTQHMSYATEPSFSFDEFQFNSEMGPVADMTTFPPTMAPHPTEDAMGNLTMDHILSTGFWDSVLVPGYNTMDGLNQGFVFGIGGSGLITPHVNGSPSQSGINTPRHDTQNSLMQMGYETHITDERQMES